MANVTGDMGTFVLVTVVAGATGAALFLQAISGDMAAGGTYPIATPGEQWESLVMEMLLTGPGL